MVASFSHSCCGVMTMAIMRLSVFSPIALGLLACSGNGDQDPPGECLVVRRVDQCCSIPIAASARDIEREPCLQHWDRPPDVSKCPGAQRCNLMTCPETFQGGSWSRVAAANGNACRFTHECTTDADCGFAADRYQCCSCPAYLPAQLIAKDACYAPADQASAGACDSCSAVFPCDACPDVTAASCSEDSSGLRKCITAD